MTSSKLAPSDSLDHCILNMRDDLFTWTRVGQALGVSGRVARRYAIARGLIEPKNQKRYTDDEIELVRHQYVSGIPIEDIARHINRSVGVVRQKIFHNMKDLRGVRNASTTRAIKKFGTEVLNLGPTKDIGKIVKTMVMEAKLAAKAQALAAKRAAKSIQIKDMINNIANDPTGRNAIIFEFRHRGLTLQEIGDAVGMTRERVRQICNDVAFERAVKSSITRAINHARLP